MTGYCLLCHLRLEGPAAPLGVPDAGAAEAFGLGALMFDHLMKHHAQAAEQVGLAVVHVQALIGLHCLEVPAGAAVLPPAAHDLETEREKMRAGISAWLADGLFKFHQVAPAAGKVN